MRTTRFTLVEIVIAMAIFALMSVALLGKRGESMELAHYAANLLKAQEIADEVLVFYRLNPFTKEALPMEKDYSPYVVSVNVAQQSINILPEDIQLDFNDLSEDEQEKQRIVLKVDVVVGFDSLRSAKPDHYKFNISTLIRHIRLKEKEEP
ncbi:MAG: hypothetical protein HQL31_04600 [Planctomycetes bacterium]|nr:hypothetical protein [Planctomycetota bacterium]